MTARRGSILIVLILSLLSLPLVAALSTEARAGPQHGIGIVMLMDDGDYFLGLESRMGMPITGTVGILAELGIANGVNGNATDNDVEFVDGALTFAFPSGRVNAYLGIGTGFCRYSDRPGGSVWTEYRFYTALEGGIEVASPTGTLFVQGKTTTVWFNPVVSVGVLF